MMNISEAVLAYKTTKPTITALIKTGEIQATRQQEGRGKAGAWHIDEEELEKRFSRRSTSTRFSRKQHDNPWVQRARPEPDEFGEYLSMSEAARRLGVAINSVYLAVRAGGYIAKQAGPGNTWFVSESELDRLAKLPKVKPLKEENYEPRQGGDKRVGLSALAVELDVAPSTLHRYANDGRIPGVKAQVGRNSFRWFFNRSDVPSIKETLRVVMRGRRGRGRPKAESKEKLITLPTVSFAPEPLGSDDLLTNKLLELAEMVRNNSMVKVTKLTVEFSFNG